MPPQEEDDDSLDLPFHEPLDDDGPDEADLAPDDLATIRCPHCKKWILEDSPRCPYCKEYQLADKQDRKTPWFIILVILAILLSLAFLFFGVSEIHPWRIL